MLQAMELGEEEAGGSVGETSDSDSGAPRHPPIPASGHIFRSSVSRLTAYQSHCQEEEAEDITGHERTQSFICQVGASNYRARELT